MITTLLKKHLKLLVGFFFAIILYLLIQCFNTSLLFAQEQDNKNISYESLPLNSNKITRKHTFDRGSMATVFPFVNADAGMDTGVPIGINKQTGLPLIFDNFSSTLTNYNMIIFGKSGAGKSVTIKTIMARSLIMEIFFPLILLNLLPV